MTSRRADDLPRQIAQLQRKINELERRGSRQGHGHAIPLGYVSRLSNVATTSTTFVDITGLTVTVDVVAGRRYKITLHFAGATHSAGSGSRAGFQVVDGAGTQIQLRNVGFVSTGLEGGGTLTAYDVPTASGSRLYKGQLRAISAGTLTMVATSTTPITLSVEDIGPA